MGDEQAAWPLVVSNEFEGDNGRPDCLLEADAGIGILPARECGPNEISSLREDPTPRVTASPSTNSASHARPAYVTAMQSTAESRVHRRVIRSRS